MPSSNAIDKTPIAGFVLVGGRSRRMGRDKALLELGGKPLLMRAVELLQPLVSEVTLIGARSRYSQFGYPVIEDQYLAEGPLVGLATGLKNSTADWNLFLACDMPHVRAEMLHLIKEQTSKSSAQAVVPKTRRHWQPLCAAYHRSCLPETERAIAAGKLAIMDLLPLLSVESVHVDAQDEGMFRNVNTEQDWQQVQNIAGVSTT
jgi:molybdopterin-guanine dinucleotide biosynthesis protein A